MRYQKDYSLSFVRFVAMCFIVACHVMQRDNIATDINGAHIEWAFWFNVGVQMFLFLSGYLYGRKEKVDTVSFYKKNFLKLLADYYIFVAAVLVIIYLSPLWDIDNSAIVGLLTFSGSTSGLGHLWFISTILFCYLMTPIFLEIVNAISKQSSVRFWIESIIILLVIHIVIKKFFNKFSPAWVNCYMLGMLYSRAESRSEINDNIFKLIIGILVLTMVPIQFKVDYWLHGELTGYFADIYGSFCNYGHIFLGIMLIFIIRFFYFKICMGKGRNKHAILDWSDKYSYDIYLTHHIFVQSPIGCVEFIDNRFIALPLAVIFTAVAAGILYWLSNNIKNVMANVFSKLSN